MPNKSMAYSLSLLCALIVAMAGCESSGETQRTGKVPVQAEQTTRGSSAGGERVLTAPAAGQATPSFRHALKRIVFAESADFAGRQLESWTSPELPGEPVKLVYHWDMLEIVLEFADDADEEAIQSLLGQIELDGEKAVLQAERNGEARQFRLQLSRPTGSITSLKLGDLPRITAERRTALGIQPATEGETAAAANTLLIPAHEYGLRLYVPMEDDRVTLQFSEPMKALPVKTVDGQPVRAEWTNDRRLLIELEEAGVLEEQSLVLSLTLESFEAISGNRPSQDGNLDIRRVPAAAWKNSRTGERIAGGPRDRYYDQIVLSPEGGHYIGIIRLGGSMGDGDGWGYAFVLERFGRAPAVIEPVFYSTIEPDCAPIRWMDESTLLYASFFGVYAYDTQSAMRRTLHGGFEDDSRYIRFAAWDAFRKKLYVLEADDPSAPSITSVYTYAGTDGSPDIQARFTEAVPANKYSMLDMPVTPVSDGVFWTRAKDGLPYTEFWGDDGSRQTAPGVVRLAAAHGVYIQSYKAGDQGMIADEWYYWQPGGAEQRIAMPPQSGDVFRSGGELMLRSGGAYYRYDPGSDAWAEWKAPVAEAYAEPGRGPGAQALYKAYEAVPPGR